MTPDEVLRDATGEPAFTAVALLSGNPDNMSVGTGFVVGATRDEVLILTCHHVCVALGDVRVGSVPARRWVPAPDDDGDFASMLEAHDLALLCAENRMRVRPHRVHATPPGHDVTVFIDGWRWLDPRFLVGERIPAVVYGHPRLAGWPGALAVDGLQLRAIGSGGVFRPGNSGAPVISVSSGSLEIVGVFSRGEQGTGYAVTIPLAVQLAVEQFSAASGGGSPGASEVPARGPSCGIGLHDATPKPFGPTAADADRALECHRRPGAYDAADPNRGQFGGSAQHVEPGLDLALSLEVTRSAEATFWFDAIVRATGDRAAAVGPFRFHLYPDYVRQRIMLRRVRDGEARLSGVSSTGVYVVGVQVFFEGRWIPLEADLRQARGLETRFLSR